MKIKKIKKSIYICVLLIILFPTFAFSQTAEGFYNLGLIAENNNDELAISYFEKAFDKNSSELKYFLKIAKYYYHNYLTEPNSISKLVKIFENSTNSLLKSNPPLELYFNVGTTFYVYSMYIPVGLVESNNSTKQELEKRNNINMNSDVFAKYGYNYLEKALQLCPKDSTQKLSMIYSFLADYYKSNIKAESDYEKAITYYKEAIKISDKDNTYFLANLYLELAKFFDLNGKFLEAKENIELAKSIKPNNLYDSIEFYEKKINKNYEIDLIKSNNSSWETMFNTNDNELIANDLLYLYNPSSIKINYPGVYRVWIKKVIFPAYRNREAIISELYNKNDRYKKYQETKLYLEFNNNNYTVNVIESISYDIDGSVIDSEKYNDTPSNIVPDSIIEQIYFYLLNMLK